MSSYRDMDDAHRLPPQPAGDDGPAAPGGSTGAGSPRRARTSWRSRALLGVGAAVLVAATIVLTITTEHQDDAGSTGSSDGVSAEQDQVDRGPAGSTSSTTSPGSGASASTSSPTSVTDWGTAAPSPGEVDPEKVLGSWVSKFYDRDPARWTYREVVDMAGRYSTPELRDRLAEAGDPTYEALATEGGTSQAREVHVSAPPAGAAPTDTPVRITRLVTIKGVTTTPTGTTDVESRLLIEVSAVGPDGRWLVSAVVGGSD